MKLLTIVARFLLRGLRNSGLLTTPLPPPPPAPPSPPAKQRGDLPLEALVSAGSPALLLDGGEQTPAGRLSPAEQQIWDDVVAGLTGHGPGGE